MPVKSDVKLATLGYVIVYVKDTEKTLPFYRDTLGMKLKMNEPGWVEFDTGATTFCLHGAKPGDTSYSNERVKGQPVPCFTVEDFYQVYESLKSSGVKFENQPQQVCEAGPGQVGMAAEFRDPDGNILSIFGMVKK